jgi:hypothetical protein
MSTVNLPRRAALPLLLASALAASLALPPAVAHAQSLVGSGRAATEVRTLPEFQAIALAGSMDLVVSQGSQQSVKVEGDDNLLGSLETVVESGRHGPTLKVRWKHWGSLSTRAPTKVTVVMSKLVSLAASGSGDMVVEAFDTPALQLSISGSSDARLRDLKTAELGVSISGSGDVSGSGSAGSLTVRIAGSGDVDLVSLKADDVKISIAGSGDAAVNANKTLDVRIAGSGDVSYTGAASVKSSVAGSGSVSRR